jgi:hypothetical protein
LPKGNPDPPRLIRGWVGGVLIRTLGEKKKKLARPNGQAHFSLARIHLRRSGPPLAGIL